MALRRQEGGDGRTVAEMRLHLKSVGLADFCAILSKGIHLRRGEQGLPYEGRKGLGVVVGLARKSEREELRRCKEETDVLNVVHWNRIECSRGREG